MDLQLKNKVFIITGGGKGIGEAITKEAAREGAKVVIVSRSEISGTEIETFLIENKADYFFIKAELSDISQCKSAIDQTIEKYGQIDCLVNNAGLNSRRCRS